MATNVPAPFIRGYVLPDGSTLDDALANPNWSSEDGITAKVGGGQSGARALVQRINVVTGVASAADSVKLIPALPGKWQLVTNAHASNSMQVFGQGTDTINGVATGTGVAQANGVSALYYCATLGAWFRILSA